MSVPTPSCPTSTAEHHAENRNAERAASRRRGCHAPDRNLPEVGPGHPEVEGFYPRGCAPAERHVSLGVQEGRPHPGHHRMARHRQARHQPLVWQPEGHPEHLRQQGLCGYGHGALETRSDLRHGCPGRHGRRPHQAPDRSCQLHHESLI